MSFDYKAASKPCDHQILLERYVVDVNDYRTLRLASDTTLTMRAPINGTNFVKVYVGGVLVAPADRTYGYSVVKNPDYIDELVAATYYNIVFNRPVRSTGNLSIEVSYLTVKATCRKCGGTGTNKDWSIKAGKLERVTGSLKMAQQALKYILCSRNPFSQNLVCAVKTYVGQKNGFGINDEEITSEVVRVLTQYQQIQSAQKTVQIVEPAELLQDIANVSAREDPADPTVMYLTVQVLGYGSRIPTPLNVALRVS